MDLRLTGKTALVTGSTAGIGRAIAETLVDEGATVYINGRDRSRTEQVAGEITGKGRAVALHGDVGTREGVDDLVARMPDKPDILVNNTGIFEPKDFFDITDEDWTRFFEINVLSGVRLARALGPAMQERKWGRIIFISSESSTAIPKEMVHYGMTKTAQLSVMRGLAKTLAGTGVTVNAVLPGPTWTEGVSEFVDKMAQREGISREQMKREFVPRNRPASLIQRFIEPSEVASLTAFLCSPLASATTGAAARVEGGILDDLG